MVWPALWPPEVRTHVVDGVGGGEQVGRLALALVAPLGAEDHDCGHRQPSSPTRTAPGHKAPGLLRQHATKSAAPAWGAWVSVRAVDPLLVITNSDAGTADVADALDGPGGAAVRRVGRGGGHVATPASSTACCTGPAPAGSWWPAATAACTPSWRRCTAATSCPSRGPRAAAARHRQRLRPRHGHPARRRGGRPAGARGRRPPGRPDRRRARRGRRQQRARRRRRRGGPPRRRLEDSGSGRSGSAGSTWAGSATRSGRCARRCTRRPCGCGSRSTATSSTTCTARC